MAIPALKRLSRSTLPVATLLLLLLVALHLMSSAVQNTSELSELFVPLLLFILVGLVGLVVLVLANVVQLAARYRRQEAGSRLMLRMAAIFMVLALVPVSVVYFYSQQFLMHGIDSWFDVHVDQAMEDALGLSRASLDLHKRERFKATQKLFLELDGSSVAGLTLSLEELREHYGATELVLMDSSGHIITSSHADPTLLVPDRPDNSILQQVRGGDNFVGLASGKEDGPLQVRVVLVDTVHSFILQALFPTSENLTTLTENVQNAYNRYRELAFLRKSLKNTFTLALALVLLFGLLAAIWAAFFTARRLVAPIADIAEGTRAVAKGDYDKQLPLPRFRDELSFLVASFNTMTRRIAKARDAADRSQHQVEAQRTYLETVLGRLSSGVLTFDADNCLRTANPAACEILQLEAGKCEGRSLQELLARGGSLQQFVESLQAPLSQSEGEWRDEITLYGGEGRQVLLCRSTPLARPEGEAAGHVLVFDDVTTLIRAQRDAAWGEVARRLAHEIKNPLTPIQLSAERLRQKYLPKMPPSDAEILDRATRTIVAQVEAMKEMVNAFSDYARPPSMKLQPVSLNELVSEVLDLYRSASPEIRVSLDSEQAEVEADPVRLRQVLHNLVKNAQEALVEHGDAWIEVGTQQKRKGDCLFVELRVSDNGPGFDDEDLVHLFEPYVTTKRKGSGLGLAVVKKIVEEHGGMIWAENREQGGACVILRLPVLVSGTTACSNCKR